MTKFEQTGINMQYNSATKEIAINKFSRSCECCCSKGLHIDCDRCAIETVHRLVIASFESLEK
jgi:hypothetical protein